ncbi:hypothetical protein, conserved [Eimeria acervulina]|uniref:AmmeMemoRadiSam system protein B n=1 Tax=Eimeria acervulina TaxID=5801 RepID=U6GD41_EIMAC|nr:hypothetical protein, conserved [Eimeria acervulina]CDI78030.1 hypothetical protein, conserved [Eimeria acervulina]
MGVVIRPSVHAGTWFPGTAADLAAAVDAMLEAASAVQGTVKTIVVPHAAFQYSGSTAAAAYKQMLSLQRTVKRVVLLATWHSDGSGVFLPPEEFTAFGSPIGSLPLDREALGALFSTGLYDTAPAELEVQEHSISVQIPFLKRVLPEGALLLPIYVGTIADEDLPMYAETLAPFFMDPALDREAVDCVLNLNAPCLEEHILKTGNLICGYSALILFLRVIERVASASGAQPEEILSPSLLKYAQSDAITSAQETSVGYAAIAFLRAS